MPRTSRHRLSQATTLLLTLACLAIPAARAHDEPPKTPAELADAREQQARLAAAGVAERRLYESRNGQPETLLLTDTFDARGRHVAQVVHDPASAQTSRSTYDAAGDWVREETWRPDGSSDRVTFAYDAGHLVTAALSEDLATGTRERLVYDHAAGADAIVVTKTCADTLVYAIRYDYEPASGRARLLAAEQTGPRGQLLVRTRQAWDGGRRRTKEVSARDGTPACAYTYDYDEAGDLRTVVRRNDTGRVVLTQAYTYAAGRLPSTVTDRDADGAVTRLLRYEYVLRGAGRAGD